MRRALATHDLTEVYRRLVAAGLNQRQISQLTGQRPSEISEIVNGRAVQSVVVLERIADGLDVPRGWMGLAYTDGTYTEVPPPVPDAQEVSEDVKRRNFINAVAGAVVWGHPILTELLTAPRSTPTPLPSRLTAVDVAAVRDLTERMRGLARHYGGQASTISAVAHRYTKLMAVNGVKQVKTDLGSALAELHTMAGWAAFDSAAAPDVIRGHFAQAMDLAKDAGDVYRMSNALYHSAMTMQNDDPNESLKLLQMAGFHLGRGDDHPRADTLASWLYLDSAHALLMLGHRDQAHSDLVRSREGWHPADTFDAADFDHVTAQAHRDLGLLNSAEALAASSVQTWGRTENRRDGVLARITLAELHLAAREPDGAYLAAQAIDGVAELQSSRARARLAPLEQALLARRDSTCADLARQARAVRLAA